MERDWMKFLKAQGDNLLFQIGKREKTLLLELLSMYPLVPAGQHRISGSIDTPEMQSNQHLLEEALAEHRNENKKQLDAMLQEPGRFEGQSDRLPAEPERGPGRMAAPSLQRYPGWQLAPNSGRPTRRRASA